MLSNAISLYSKFGGNWYCWTMETAKRSAGTVLLALLLRTFLCALLHGSYTPFFISWYFEIQISLFLLPPTCPHSCSNILGFLTLCMENEMLKILLVRIDYCIWIHWMWKVLSWFLSSFTQTKRTKKAGIVGKYGKYFEIWIYDL